MKIALAQLNPTVGDFAGNSTKILEFAQRAESVARTWPCFPNYACADICPST